MPRDPGMEDERVVRAGGERQLERAIGGGHDSTPRQLPRGAAQRRQRGSDIPAHRAPQPDLVGDRAHLTDRNAVPPCRLSHSESLHRLRYCPACCQFGGARFAAGDRRHRQHRPAPGAGKSPRGSPPSHRSRNPAPTDSGNHPATRRPDPRRRSGSPRRCHRPPPGPETRPRCRRSPASAYPPGATLKAVAVAAAAAAGPTPPARMVACGPRQRLVRTQLDPLGRVERLWRSRRARRRRRSRSAASRLCGRARRTSQEGRLQGERPQSGRRAPASLL